MPVDLLSKTERCFHSCVLGHLYESLLCNTLILQSHLHTQTLALDLNQKVQNCPVWIYLAGYTVIDTELTH